MLQLVTSLRAETVEEELLEYDEDEDEAEEDQLCTLFYCSACS